MTARINQTIAIGTVTTMPIGVNTPRTVIVIPTIISTNGEENNCVTNVELISCSVEVLVTKIPVAVEISKDGMALTNPSPIVTIVYFDRASESSRPPITTPIRMPPMTLTNVIKIPITASFLTNFAAPSMEPKKAASS